MKNSGPLSVRICSDENADWLKPLSRTLIWCKGVFSEPGGAPPVIPLDKIWNDFEMHGNVLLCKSTLLTEPVRRGCLIVFAVRLLFVAGLPTHSVGGQTIIMLSGVCRRHLSSIVVFNTLWRASRVSSR